MPDSTQLGGQQSPVVSASRPRPPEADWGALARRADPTANAALRAVTRQECEAAARSWLLLSTAGVDEARRDWRTTGIALLKAGPLFAAIRIDAELVHHVVGTTECAAADRILTVLLGGGPVWMDQVSRRYYALVPPSVADQRQWRDRRYAPQAECLGAGSYVGVPDPSMTDWDRCFSYWSVPMQGPGTLCDAREVAGFVQRGQHLMRVAKGGVK